MTPEERQAARCEHCVYVRVAKRTGRDQFARELEEWTEFFCHRNAPRLVWNDIEAKMEHSWPEVSEDDFCGEWKPAWGVETRTGKES